MAFKWKYARLLVERYVFLDPAATRQPGPLDNDLLGIMMLITRKRTHFEVIERRLFKTRRLSLELSKAWVEAVITQRTPPCDRPPSTWFVCKCLMIL